MFEVDDFEAATERFLEWFKSIGGEFRDDLIAIKDLRERSAGRGIIAIKDIPRDTTLFTIPRDAIINVETSKLIEKIPTAFDGPNSGGEGGADDDEPLDSWASLIIVMVYEYLQGDNSRWKPYFDVLPQTFDTPLFWTDTELKELQGTCLTTEKIGKQESDEMIRSRIMPVIKENASVFYPENSTELDDDELLVLVHRMGSTIMAYAFDLEDDEAQQDEDEDGWEEDREGKTMLGMVPMADILNANAEFNAHVNHGDKLEVNSLRSTLLGGSEVLNYYGPLASSELLRRYGYITPEHRRYDVVELPWDLVVQGFAKYVGISDESASLVSSEMDREDMEDSFIIERICGDPDSEGRLGYDVSLPRQVSFGLEEQLAALMKQAKRSLGTQLKEKRKRESLYYLSVLSALIAKQEQYPTTRQEDEELLMKNDLPKRHRMAIEVRLGEKKLLGEAITMVGELAKAMDDGPGEPSKKARIGD